jgi:LysR family nitrogen assimilation transcriptional regulator
MDLQQLQSFVRVAELGSFTRAAAALDVPQPSLSRHVRQLEVELHEHLLVRTGRGVELTDAGKCLQTYGNAILELTRQAREELKSLRGKLTGRALVGLSPRVARVLTPALVRSFRARYPEASISISEGLSVSLREDLLLGRLELALLFDPPASPKLEYVPLFREDLVLCGRPQRGLPLPVRLAAAELSRYPLVLPAMPHAIRALIETSCRAKGIVLNVVAEVDTVQTLLDLAQDGQGYAIVPRSSVGQSGLKVSLIERPRIRNLLVVAFSKQRPLSRLAQATFELIREQDIGTLLEG